jgi:hypothetical protein
MNDCTTPAQIAALVPTGGMPDKFLVINVLKERLPCQNTFDHVQKQENS